MDRQPGDPDPDSLWERSQRDRTTAQEPQPWTDTYLDLGPFWSGTDS